MKTSLGLSGLLLIMTVAAASRADVVSSARELAKEGVEAYDQGRFEESAEKTKRAYALVRVPTLAVHLARTYVRLGRLVEASELYLEAVRLKSEDSWQNAQFEAQRTAEIERASLLPRVPRLMIEVHGVDPAQVTITLDGTQVPTALVGAEQMVDPGTRVVIATGGATEVRQTALLTEGAHTRVVLNIKPTLAQHSSEVNPRTQQSIASHQPQSSLQAILGWTGIGLAAAGVGFGIWQNQSAKSQRDELLSSQSCSDGVHCDSSKSDDVDAYNRARHLRTVGYVAGGVFAAAGVTLLLWPTKKREAPAVGLTLGPNFVNLQGAL